MRRDDKRNADVSPPAGYGNRNEAQREAEATRQRAERDRQHEPDAPVVSNADMARFVFLRDKINRTDVEEVEFDALDVRIVDKPPVLEPLTPAEVGKLAEQRADPDQHPDADLMAREGVPIPEPEVKRDPALVGPITIDLLTSIIGLLVAIVGTAPMLHGSAAQGAQLRDALDRLIYHATPEAEKPPEPEK